MVPIHILLASDAPEDEGWIKRSLADNSPEPHLSRTAASTQFFSALLEGAFHLIVVRPTLAWFDRSKMLHTLQDLPRRPQVVYLTEADEAVPGFMAHAHEGEHYVIRTSEPTAALTPVVQKVFSSGTSPTPETPQNPFDSLPVGWFRMDGRERILSANARLVAMLGYATETDLKSRPLRDLSASSIEMTRLRAELASQPQIQAFETEFIRQNGSLMAVRLNLHRGSRPGDATPVWEGTVEPLNLQAAVSQVREVEQFSRTVLGGVQEGIIFFDRELRYRVWNPFMESLTGLSTSQMVGTWVGQNTLWGEPVLGELLAQVLRGETVSRKEASFYVRQSGKKGFYEAAYVPYMNSAGDITGVLGFIREVTGAKLEKEEHQRQLLMEQKQRQLAEGLGRIILAMSALPSLPALLELICGEAAAFLEMDSAQIWLLEGDALEGAAAFGLRETSISDLYVPLSEKDHLVVEVLLTKKPTFLYDLLEDSHMIHSGLSGIFQVRSMIGVPLLIAGQAVGVLLLIDTRRPHSFNADELETILYLGSQAAMAVENARLFASLQEARHNIVQAYDATLTGWAKALELRDRDTEGHTQRVVEMTLKLARAFGMSEEELVHVYRGALLHDIGKMGIPDNILRKPGSLDEGEWKIMRDHPSYAYEMLKPIDYLDHALDIPYCHHEKWNGTGYPRGLKGEEIPLCARIFAVVDVWDALSFDRPYRKALPQELVFDYIRTESGKHFDPQVVEKFLETFGPGN